MIEECTLLFGDAALLRLSNGRLVNCGSDPVENDSQRPAHRAGDKCQKSGGIHLKHWRILAVRAYHANKNFGTLTMKTVFDASSNIEAHLVMHQLQQAGIEASIQGEYLQGGIGELPAIGNIRVMVPVEDEEIALQVIADWEAA